MEPLNLTLPGGIAVTGIQNNPTSSQVITPRSRPLIVAFHGGSYECHYFDADAQHTARIPSDTYGIPFSSLDRPDYGGTSSVLSVPEGSSFPIEEGKRMHEHIFPALWTQHAWEAWRASSPQHYTRKKTNHPIPSAASSSPAWQISIRAASTRLSRSQTPSYLGAKRAFKRTNTIAGDDESVRVLGSKVETGLGTSGLGPSHSLVAGLVREVLRLRARMCSVCCSFRSGSGSVVGLIEVDALPYSEQSAVVSAYVVAMCRPSKSIFVSSSYSTTVESTLTPRASFLAVSAINTLMLPQCLTRSFQILSKII
ncbi:hypothetical protein KC349_g121 [Hortaea werneckii]|nr:hypothetical protein KC349_g121 [Hortaea werneckii]